MLPCESVESECTWKGQQFMAKNHQKMVILSNKKYFKPSELFNLQVSAAEFLLCVFNTYSGPEKNNLVKEGLGELFVEHFQKSDFQQNIENNNGF